MEFHDILHGHIRIDDREISTFLADLLDSSEVHRLRNMRQMNFDVPLIQELGRSRRLPHSIGVAYLAYRLTAGVNIHRSARKAFIAAALLHDAAIPPFGHLVESELRARDPSFSHENRLKNLIFGLDGKSNKYRHVVHGKASDLVNLLNKYDVDPFEVLRLVCPERGASNAISAGIDIDNIDNVHRMACMLGWHDARENMSLLLSHTRLGSSGELLFEPAAEQYILNWMRYRSRIYTMIIAHPQCVAHNALQADLSRAAVQNGIITSDDWRMTEPEFEQRLRDTPVTSDMAWQLISGCDYVLEDYVWFKGYEQPLKMSNSDISRQFSEAPDDTSGHTIFVWNEAGLISRRVTVRMTSGEAIECGTSSRSCMIALVRTRRGKRQILRRNDKWRHSTAEKFFQLIGGESNASFPEEYTGEFEGADAGLKLGHH